MPLLDIQNATMRFGGLTAVENFTERIEPEELVGLIGPNGAGKTTVFNMITGVYEPTEGTVSLSGTKLNGRKPNQIAARGIARTFQNIRLFPSMTVADNVRVGFVKNAKNRLVRSVVQIGGFDREEREFSKRGDELLEMFGLLDQRDEMARNLSYGDQRRVEIVRALATDPKLLLLDEPAAGMNPTEKTELMHLIRRLRDTFKLAILLIEHDMKVVMGVCERIGVLDYGKRIAAGTPDEVKCNPKVIEAYLGEA